MIRFIHTADIHFGVENYGRIDVKTGIHSRLLDFVRALNYCIDYAIEESVDFFLFSGDAYKTHHPSQTQQKLLLQCFLRLYQANIPIVIVVGNHDNPLSFGKANTLEFFGELPLNGFHVITKPTSLKLKTKSGPVQIVGIPWPTRNNIAIGKQVHKSAIQITEYISHAVAAIIKNYASKLDPTIPAILAGHLTVSTGIFSGSEKRAIYGTDPILLPSQLTIEPFDYVALGHLHRYQNLNPNGHPALVYSGSIERIDFGERKEEKGFCIVTVNQKTDTVHKFIKITTRPFQQIEVDLQPDKPQTEQIINAIKQINIQNAIVKIIYQVPSATKDTVDLKAIQRACFDAFYIVSIIPIRKFEARERRIGGALKVNMDLSTLLDVYFSNKPELTGKKERLIEKTLQLLQEHQQQQEQ